MSYCKKCGCVERIKNGTAHNKQRYMCKGCGKTYVDGDSRTRYSIDKKVKVVKMYLEGIGIRSIERLENVSNPLIIKWIRGFSKILEQQLKSAEVPTNLKDISIIELDELFTYCKKKQSRVYVWLAVEGTEVKLLILK